MSETDPETPQSAPRIAYLTGAYPAVSHTFILREVEALRRLGLDIVTCSIRRSGPEHLRGPAEKHAAETTFHVIATGKSPAALLAAQKPALRDPGRYFGTLARAWRMRRPGLRAALYQLFYFVEATILARHLQAEGVTHIHNHFAGPSASVAMLAARLAADPLFLHAARACRSGRAGALGSWRENRRLPLCRLYLQLRPQPGHAGQRSGPLGPTEDHPLRGRSQSLQA
jgi:hypothetical protein